MSPAARCPGVVRCWGGAVTADLVQPDGDVWHQDQVVVAEDASTRAPGGSRRSARRLSAAMVIVPMRGCTATNRRLRSAGHAGPDKVTAALADGVLTVTASKTEADKPRRILITAG